MVLCAIDDLMFSIKISTAAKALGVDIYFERAAENVVPRIRETRPSLVIFDLNSGRLQPLDVIRTMKADAELTGIHTLGYVSHVQTETIAAARQAGIDEVLARSAFADRLGQILTSAGTTTPQPRPPAG
jgi:DNA-binding NarL/FixJ family response regulator